MRSVPGHGEAARGRATSRGRPYQIPLSNCKQLRIAPYQTQRRYRNNDFKLVDKYGNTIATSLQYTVYEQLDNFKSSAHCKKNDNYTGMSPCEPADGSENNPYNVFYDSHSLGVQTAPAGGIQINQSFL
jgi:hypothetical protein